MKNDLILKRHPRSLLPEFTDSKGLEDLFRIHRGQAYALAAQGKIRTVCLRKPGARKGKRLFDCQSVREYLAKHYDAVIVKETAIREAVAGTR
jgi:hypothetical protein